MHEVFAVVVVVAVEVAVVAAVFEPPPHRRRTPQSKDHAPLDYSEARDVSV